ncbi:MAG: transcriptional regulator, GntR family with aminotransferase domain, partial [Capsulimonas sp.]|nr:transcriptional regulator, GntR family with aminotransferase domain [Capsulimonas sp.]
MSEARPQKYTSRLGVIAQVETHLRERVQTGVWAASMLLPSRRDLAAEFGVDLNTVQRAIAPLLADGTLRADGGRGTYVADAAKPSEEALAPQPSGGSGSTRLGLIYSLHPGAQDVGSFWTRLTMRAAEEAFARSGGTILSRNLMANGGLAEPMRDALSALLKEDVDGIVVVAINNVAETAEEVISAVDLERNPVVYTSWHAVRPPLAHVYFDSDHEGYQAA